MQQNHPNELIIRSGTSNMKEENTVLSTESLFRLLHLIKTDWVLFTAIITCITGVTIVYLFSLPRSYTSTAILLPESNNGLLSGNLGNLSSLVGLKTSNEEDAISPDIYPKVISTSVFKAELMKQKILLGNRQEISIYDYFSNHQQKPWWNVKKGHPVKEDLSRLNPTHFNKQEEKISNTLSSSISCMVDQKTSMITISCECQDPVVAQQIATIVLTRLKDYVIDYRTSKARNDVKYYQGLFKQSKEQYEKARRLYGAYADKNEDLVLESYRSKTEDLENDMQLKYNIYTQMMTQLEQAKAKLQEKTPVYTTIQPATIPLKPSAPKRMLGTILAFFISLFLAICTILFKESVKDYRNSKK